MPYLKVYYDKEMINIILNIIISALAVFGAAMLVPGVEVTALGAILAAIVIGVINALIRPVLYILTLPINILTLGLFSFVINAALIMLAASVVPDFSINNFLTALIFSIVLAVINLFFSFLKRD